MSASATPSGVSLPLGPLVRTDASGAAFTVRAYEAGERARLERFYQTFEPKRAAQGLPPAEPQRITSWLDNVLRAGIHLLVFRGAELIGHAFILPTSRADEGEYAVFLSREERGRGVGTALGRVAVETARAAGLHRLWLTVEPSNRAAVRSYQKAGFRFVPSTHLLLEAEMECLL